MRTVLGVSEELTAGSILNGRRLLEKLPRLLGRRGPTSWRVECLKCGKMSPVKSDALRRGKGCRCDMKGHPWKFSEVAIERRKDAYIRLKQWRAQARKINQSVDKRGFNGCGKVDAEALEVSWNLRGGQCLYCEAVLSLDKNKFNTVQWDHKNPLSRGGRNEYLNLAPACRPCNSAKSDLTAEEFKLVITGQFVPLFGILRARHCQD